MRATTPETCGPAIDVPLLKPYIPFRVLEYTESPGAAISGLIRSSGATGQSVGPRLLKSSMG